MLVGTFKIEDSLEERLKDWVKPALLLDHIVGSSEMRKIKRTLQAATVLQDKEIVFIEQGSSLNRTTVARTSDFDICIKSLSSFYYQLPEGADEKEYGIIPPSYTYEEYKKSIFEVLITEFGKDAVRLGEKSIKVSNRVGVTVDVVPCFEYRLYSEKGVWESGHKYFSSSGESIINFPEQHYRNGMQKNDETGGKYKKFVTILKKIKQEFSHFYWRLNNDSSPSGIESLNQELKRQEKFSFHISPSEIEKVKQALHYYEHSSFNISSFIIECVLYNVPEFHFNKGTDTESIRSVLEYVITSMTNECAVESWTEVNNLLLLFNENRKSEEIKKFFEDCYQFLFQGGNYVQQG